MGNSTRAELGKYLLDISKLTFGGIFLSGIVTGTANSWLLVGVGALIVLMTAVIGFSYIKKG